MRDRPDPKALLRAFKSCLGKLDAQAQGLLAEATAAELEDAIWLTEEFALPRGMHFQISIRLELRRPPSSARDPED